MIGGGNDVIASIFNISINQVSWVLRILCIVGPPIAFVITKRICLSLQKSDEHLLHHGIESGTIRRLPTGEFVEETVPLPATYRLGIKGADDDHAAIEAGHAEPGQVAVVTHDEPPRSKGFFRPKGSNGVDAEQA